MKIIISSILILVAVIWVYFAMTDWKWPFGKANMNSETTGYIYDLKYNNRSRMPVVDSIYYFFTAGNQVIFSKASADNAPANVFIGNRIRLAYDVENTDNNEIKTYYSDFKSHQVMKFYSASDEGYEEIELINNMIFIREFAKFGVQKSNCIGLYHSDSDTIISEIVPSETCTNNRKLNKWLVLEDSNGISMLKHVASGVFYQQFLTR